MVVLEELVVGNRFAAERKPTTWTWMQTEERATWSHRGRRVSRRLGATTWRQTTLERVWWCSSIPFCYGRVNDIS